MKDKTILTNKQSDKQPEVFLSIIVPVYNVEKYLEECLDSLQNQNGKKDIYEIICIDDGSTDKSGVILDGYAERFSNINVFHKENGGVSSARNVGLKNAKGKYIWFVDSDDLIAHDSIKLIVSGIKNNDYPDTFYIGVNSFKDDNVNLDVILDFSEDPSKYAGWMFTEIIKSEIIINNSLLFDENVFYGEDDIFCVFVEQHVKTTAKLDMVIYYYRQREGSALHSAITNKNIERFIKTYKSDLLYANNYDFFWYKKDAVYRMMPNLMAFIAEQPIKYSFKIIKQLKESDLFPLKKDYKTWLKQNNSKVNKVKWIRQHSVSSYLCYVLLRIYVRL